MPEMEISKITVPLCPSDRFKRLEPPTAVVEPEKASLSYPLLIVFLAVFEAASTNPKLPNRSDTPSFKRMIPSAPFLSLQIISL
jgi:hypothetical protein